MDDPHARHGVVIDMRNAVLMDTIDVSAVEPYTDGQPHDIALALSLGGRINKTRESPLPYHLNGLSNPDSPGPAM
jgi:hypothetical protein